MSYTIVLYYTTPIHCTPLPLHPPVMNTDELRVSASYLKELSRHPAANLPAKILDSRGFDSSVILIIGVWNSQAHKGFPCNEYPSPSARRADSEGGMIPITITITITITVTITITTTINYYYYYHYYYYIELKSFNSNFSSLSSYWTQTNSSPSSDWRQPYLSQQCPPLLRTAITTIIIITIIITSIILNDIIM